MRFSLDGDEKQAAYNNTNGLKADPTYDPDLAHPAYNQHLDPGLDTSHISERRILTKIDLRVIPILSLLYLLSFLDRTNVANAAIFGLQKDLKLSSLQYQTALTIFFVPYVLFEIPSNILLKRLKPHVWLSLCMLSFGAATLGQGFTTNFAGIMTTRAILGIAEAGTFPGCFYLISMWYRRSEAQKRFTFFFASTSLAGAFGGLIASAIGKLDGALGYRGWRWVFIIEGAATILFAIAFFFIIPDFPENAKWLTPAEAAFVKKRLQDDQGKSGLERRIRPRDLVNCFKDYKFILGGLMYFGLIVPAYSYAYFAPTIIKGYGYSNIGTQLRSVPPWAVSFVFSMLVAIFSDFFRHRYVFVMIPILVSITGFSIVMTVHTKINVQYGALFMAAAGTYAAMPIIVCWFQMNLGGHHRRAVGSAWQIAFGNIGGIIATYIFPASDAKYFYRKGYSICLGFICLSALSSTLYLIACWSQNRRRQKAGPDVGMTEYEKLEKGDLNNDYRYML